MSKESEMPDMPRTRKKKSFGKSGYGKKRDRLHMSKEAKIHKQFYEK